MPRDESKVITKLASAVIKREEKRFKPRITRAYGAFARKLMALANRRELERALESKDIRKVMTLFSKEKVEGLLGPMSGILKDELLKIGHIAFREVQK